MPLSNVAVRKAVFERLDAVLGALPTPVPVFSYVPQDTRYPYVRIGDVTLLDADTQTSEMKLHQFVIHVFDKSKASSVPVETIQSKVYEALQNYAMTIPDFNVVYCRQDTCDAFQQGQPDDRYWHGVQQFNIMVEAL